MEDIRIEIPNAYSNNKEYYDVSQERVNRLVNDYNQLSYLLLIRNDLDEQRVHSIMDNISSHLQWINDLRALIHDQHVGGIH